MTSLHDVSVVTRLCLVVEASQEMAHIWHEMRGCIVEPVLRALEQGQCGMYEICVIFFNTPTLQT